MGWASGSGVVMVLIRAAKRIFHERNYLRAEFYSHMIDAFWDQDCDTLDEATGIDPEFDAVLKQKYKKLGYD